MTRPICILIVAMAMIGLISGIVIADPSYLGSTGNILTPNDKLANPGELSLSFHMLQLSQDVQVISGNVGVTETLELGVARFDPRAAGLGVDTLISGKYLVLEETAARPSVMVGVIDVGGGIALDGNPSAYVVLGKNLTPYATGFSGDPVPPLRGYVGYGMGIYDGLFVSAELSLGPTATLMGEYISGLSMKNAINENSVFNIGARFELIVGVRGDVALINGNDFAFGVSYTGTSF